jgi:hypothetical protein
LNPVLAAAAARDELEALAMISDLIASFISINSYSPTLP